MTPPSVRRGGDLSASGRLAAQLQPNLAVRQINQTLGGAAGIRPAQWIMTTGFVVDACCLIATAAGLQVRTSKEFPWPPSYSSAKAGSRS